MNRMPCPLQDWSKASPYDQPMVPTLQRRKDRVEHLREAEMGSPAGGYPGIGSEDAPRPRMSPATIAAKVPAAAGRAQRWAALGGSQERNQGADSAPCPRSMGRRCPLPPVTWPWS